MSWSISSRGSKAEVAKYLDEQGPVAVAHVQGVERALADQALGLARAVVAENEDVKYETSVSMNGSASFNAQGEQFGQTLSINIQQMTKP